MLETDWDKELKELVKRSKLEVLELIEHYAMDKEDLKELRRKICAE